MARRIERLAGIAAGLSGAAMLVFALYGPTGSSTSTEVRSDGTTVTSSGTSSLVASQDLSLVLLVFLALIALALFGVAFGAHMHADSGTTEAYGLLWISTIMLGCGALLSIFSIGLFFVPAVLLALVACIAGSARTPRQQPHDPARA